ncbi:hypothetical protein [Phascolarctobacterium succinatutens]|uniref:hypothetical protein n=1 Tax=Phascolarctobacterium succinatutens TaxID=626940 RepID=UPI00201B847F|nr:hypothetical protein [Phascolarctobacterium succinatutens]UQT41454.1 hypothetical protein M5E81_08195 [Phascolarctobacterium succinatutens]
MKKIIILILTLIALIFSSTVLAGNRFVDIGEFYNQKIFIDTQSIVLATEKETIDYTIWKWDNQNDRVISNNIEYNVYMGKSRCTRTVVRKISTKELMEDTLRPNANWQPVYQGTPTHMGLMYILNVLEKYDRERNA